MTTFLLVRHAAHALGGETIAGRTPGVHLSAAGVDQAGQLASRLAELPIQAIYCSPQDRTRDTAAPLSQRLNLPVQIRENLDEIDFGEWMGRRLEDLRPIPLWKQWNEFRSGTRIPGGELMVEVQARMVREMVALRERHPDDCIALFSHGDPIKAAILHFLGMPLDLLPRFEISLASISTIIIGEYGPWVYCVNNTGRIELP